MASCRVRFHQPSAQLLSCLPPRTCIPIRGGMLHTPVPVISRLALHQLQALRYLSTGSIRSQEKACKPTAALGDTDTQVSRDGGWGDRSSSGSSDDYGIDPASIPPPATPEEDAGSKELKAKVIREALQSGKLGLGFSAGGFLYGYHLGVLWELRERGILPDPGSPGAIKMAGSSAGSLAIATFACGLDVPKANKALFEFASNCRSHGTRARLSTLLRDFLHAYLPDDAHERCRDLCYVAMTRVFPYWKPELIHRFHDKEDLIQALITSCHIPLYANGAWMTKFRGRYYMDGGVAAFIPRPPTPTVIKVCCFPVNDVLAKVQPTVQNYERVASLLDVAISPDAFEEFPHSYQQLLNWALVPADDKLLLYLVEKGRRDAAAWAASLNLVIPHDAETASGQQVVVIEDAQSAQQLVGVNDKANS